MTQPEFPSFHRLEESLDAEEGQAQRTSGLECAMLVGGVLALGTVLVGLGLFLRWFL